MLRLYKNVKTGNPMSSMDVSCVHVFFFDTHKLFLSKCCNQLIRYYLLHVLILAVLSFFLAFALWLWPGSLYICSNLTQHTLAAPNLSFSTRTFIFTVFPDANL